jgi:hypothetical protein
MANIAVCRLGSGRGERISAIVRATIMGVGLCN